MVSSEMIISEKAENVLAIELDYFTDGVRLDPPEDTPSIRLESPEPSCSGEVSSLHNTAADKDPASGSAPTFFAMVREPTHSGCFL